MSALSSIPLSSIPLSLYVHTPWCKRKCPYCDFNSHEIRGTIPQEDYLLALSADLHRELQRPEVAGREINNIFIGGGTPSALDAHLLSDWVRKTADTTPLAKDAEITMEANPESVESTALKLLRDAGVNRLSIGAQSFSDTLLHKIGRIHNGGAALKAFEVARDVAFDNINIDIMFGLPEQTLEQSMSDIDRAIEIAPEHISFYQLTLEPNTLFHAKPPTLPGEDTIAEMEQSAIAHLDKHGYERYEISAYARDGKRCAHNMNYWRFGDYIGIGAGAHGKLSLADQAACIRYIKHRHPETYIKAHGGQATDASSFVSSHRTVSGELLSFEFMLNASRLTDGFKLSLFEKTTNLPASVLSRALTQLEKRGLLTTKKQRNDTHVQPTRNGLLFLNEIQGEFLPSEGLPVGEPFETSIPTPMDLFSP